MNLGETFEEQEGKSHVCCSEFECEKLNDCRMIVYGSAMTFVYREESKEDCHSDAHNY